jgi:LacI family transcriptional regulator
MNDKRIALLREIGLPFVVHGRASGIPDGYSWLDVNNTSAFHRATEFLTDLGHRRIALVNGLETMDFAYRRRRGYETGLAAKGISIDPAIMRQDEMTESFGYTSVVEMMGLSTPPTAFLVSSIISALGVQRALQERGLEMGRDVSVVTHDDTLSYLANGADVPIFTSTRSSVRDAGRMLSEMLISLINGEAVGHQQKLLEAELTVGRSTGPAPASVKTA